MQQERKGIKKNVKTKVLWEKYVHCLWESKKLVDKSTVRKSKEKNFL